MYVCVCKGVTDKQIAMEMHAGATGFDDIQDRLEVGLCCGQCRDYAKEVIDSVEANRLGVAV